MSATTFIGRTVALATVAGVGAIVGYALRDAEEDARPTSKTTTLETVLKRRTKALGEATLIQAKADAVANKIDKKQYLKQLYRGLYCYARVGQVFSSAHADYYRAELAHLHQQVRPRKDKALSDWYSAGSDRDLVELLSICPEIRQLQIDPRYIANLFGEKQDDLKFGGLSEEYSDWFAAT